MKAKECSGRLPATISGPEPGDYPLGSLESRAAARAIIESRERSNAIPDNLTEEEIGARIKHMTDEELSAALAPLLGKTIAEVQQLTDEDLCALIQEEEPSAAGYVDRRTDLKTARSRT